MNTYSALDTVISCQKSILNQLSHNMQAIREMMDNENRESRNVRVANELLVKNNYDAEPLHKLRQWGVMECEIDAQVQAIIYEVIDYRRDASLHHTGLPTRI